MGRRGGGSGGFIGCWLVSAFVLFCLMVVWSLATPLGAASDEPAQIIKAAAVARGEFLGQPTQSTANSDRNHTGRAVMTVIVPATYGQSDVLANCYRHKVKVTAACAPGASQSGRLVAATTYVGRYPPLYYLLIGSPSLLWHSSAGIYLMRVLSGLVSSLLIGLAIAGAAVWGRSRLLLGGVVVATTPMVVFLSSVVNPSGMEIAASIAVWTLGLVLVRDRHEDPPTGLIVAFFVSACVLTATRSLSPLWLALIVLVLLCLEPQHCWQLLRRTSVRVGSAITALVTALSIVYIVAAQALAITASGIPLKASATAGTVINLYQGRASFYLNQTVGVFGWLDTPAPGAVVFLVGILVVGLLWLAFATARRRETVVLIGILVASVVLPIAIDVKNALQLHSDVWQSRYAMPLYVGVPLVAAAVAGRRRTIRDVPARRMIVIIAVVVAGCQWACYFVALHRYTVGGNGPVSITLHRAGGWTPPLPAALLLGLALVAVVAYAWTVLRLAGGGDHPTTPAVEDVAPEAAGAGPAEEPAPVPTTGH